MFKNANVFQDDTYRISQVIVQNKTPETSLIGKASVYMDVLPKAEVSASLRILPLSPERRSRDHWLKHPSELLVLRQEPLLSPQAYHIRDIGRCPPLQEVLHNGQVPHEGGHVERCQAGLE